MAIARQHIGIGAAHGAHQQAVLHRAAIDEEVLVIGHAPVESRQAGNACQPRRPARHIDGNAIFGQFARNDAGDAGRQFLPRLDGKGAAAVMVQREAHLRPGHGQAADNIQAGGIFGPRRTQELAPRRYLAEQVLHPDAGAGRKRSGALFRHYAMVHHAAPAFAGRARAAFDGQPCDRGDGRQRLAPEAQSHHAFDMIVGQLGRGVPFQRQCHVGRRHAAAVVRNLDQGKATFGQPDSDVGGSGIQRVLDQFLQRGGGPFHHLAGGDAVDEIVGKAANDRHGQALATNRPGFETGSGPIRRIHNKILAFARALV